MMADPEMFQPLTSIDYASVREVAIIGAGVAGLQTARALRNVGIEVAIFEKTDDLGGVWRENYADFGLQVPRDLYEFPDFPWPADTVGLFPDGPTVLKYIRMYAEKFDLLPLIKFNTPVVGLAVASPGDYSDWIVKYEENTMPQTQHFDFVVIATGMYSWPPHMPLAQDHHTFKGQIIHSCTFTDKEIARDKKVIVVGGGKSAVDNAVAAAQVGSSTTILSREWHWPVPRYLLDLVPFKFGTYSRFGHFMLRAYHEQGLCARWAHWACAPAKWLWWRVVELMFRCQFRLSGDMTPDVPIELDLFKGGQILTYEFRDMVKQKKVLPVSGAIEKFTPAGVILSDGRELEADIVIYGTGFTKSYDIFDQEQSNLGIEKDGLYLYRNILPPNLPGIGFIGSEVTTFNNILTHGLQALWLQRLFKGRVQLPGVSEMERAVGRDRAWKGSWMRPSNARAATWQLHMMKYHDILMKDMGEACLRKSNFLSEALMPYNARDYAELFQ